MKVLKLVAYGQGLVWLLYAYGVYAHEREIFVMKAYENKVAQIMYSIAQQNQHALSFGLERMPICMYTPLNMQELDASSLTKTYFLPRTRYKNSSVKLLHQQMIEKLKLLGVQVVIQEFQDKNYGIQMKFVFDPSCQYKVTHVVDTDNNVIHFNFV
jgi:hypothetical protein